jgi:hypothetical protein
MIIKVQGVTEFFSPAASRHVSPCSPTRWNTNSGFIWNNTGRPLLCSIGAFCSATVVSQPSGSVLHAITRSEILDRCSIWKHLIHPSRTDRVAQVRIDIRFPALSVYEAVPYELQHLGPPFVGPGTRLDRPRVLRPVDARAFWRRSVGLL